LNIKNSYVKGQSMNKFLKLLLGTSLYLLEQSDSATRKVRERAIGEIEDLRDVAREKYETAADRVARASRAIRGDDSQVVGNALRFVAGVGVGIGVGLILAPASGEETRSVIAGKVQDIGDKVRQQFSSEGASATGTRG
jgi:ElaB/YqjD/DUF883 family membrane-anchored ribosome-binding protein